MKLTCKQLVGGAALLTAMTAVQTAQATSPRSGGGAELKQSPNSRVLYEVR